MRGVRVRVTLSDSGWKCGALALATLCVIRCLAVSPVAATTSPIYVTVGGAPVRSAEDAEYFLRWIGRVEAVVMASKDWNTDGERGKALELMRQARAEFERRRGGS